MKSFFADTFYFLAVLNRRDPTHAKALEFYGGSEGRFVTTEWVLTEVADANADPDMRAGFKKLFRVLENDDPVEIIPASHDLFQRGLELYFDRPDKEWSLTDCISFTAMRDQNLIAALTGDRHFEQAGFIALLRRERP